MSKSIILAVFSLVVLISGCVAVVHLQDTSDIDTEEDISAAPKIDFSKPTVALSFDDGPLRPTAVILDVLEAHDVRATFFMLGRLVEEWEDTVKRAAKNGNEIAGHAWAHHQLSTLSDQAIKDSILSTSAVIEKVTGVPRPLFFRPPFGDANRRVANIAAELGYAIVNWNLDVGDWSLLNADLIYNAIMRRVRDKSIILLHDIHPTTAEAVKRIVPALVERGYQFVTVSEMIEHLYGPMQPGRVYGEPGVRP
ncbi:MAG: polysaccharide deacetylase family protein [Treponema sp.]|nr:polysaccharide deacetylase family protein [Treponema sp.]